LFGDHKLQTDLELERRAGEIAVIQQREPYSIVTFNPAEILYIERQIFAHIIDSEDMAEYVKYRQELPPDTELRKKYL